MVFMWHASMERNDTSASEAREGTSQKGEWLKGHSASNESCFTRCPDAEWCLELAALTFNQRLISLLYHWSMRLTGWQVAHCRFSWAELFGRQTAALSIIAPIGGHSLRIWLWRTTWNSPSPSWVPRMLHTVYCWRRWQGVVEDKKRKRT